MIRKGIRLAKPADAKQLAELHYICSANQPGGFMFQLGKQFLTEYYRVFLNEPTSVILCAENASGDVVGLVSGSLATEEHMAAMRRNKVRLAISALPSLIRSPRLLGSIYVRQKAESADLNSGGYIVTAGAREEFWAWQPNDRSSGAIELHKKWLFFMRMLGVSQIKLEVDLVNKNVAKMHELMGAVVVKEFSTPDGRHRLVMEYLLDQPLTTKHRMAAP